MWTVRRVWSPTPPTYDVFLGQSNHNMLGRRSYCRHDGLHTSTRATALGRVMMRVLPNMHNIRTVHLIFTVGVGYTNQVKSNQDGFTKAIATVCYKRVSPVGIQQWNGSYFIFADLFSAKNGPFFGKVLASWTSDI